MQDQFKELYQKTKKGTQDIVVVEGIHAFKHAARFGAEFVDAVTDDKKTAVELMRHIAADADVEHVEQYVREISHGQFHDIASSSLRTGIVAIAKKPVYTIADATDKQIIFIENPHDINNVGAVVRVAAGYGVGAVAVSGEISPWHMLAIRAGAGLQWAVPVLHIASLEDIAQGRKVCACDANGVSIRDIKMEKNSVLIFGTEREGITHTLKEHSDQIISIPMQKGVSSLNLATSVSAVLYGGQFT
ncbi:MAG: TrmH family RNA methyltransferase [Parcubacteria group bacterium]|jgi:TrmH family RNA methyltransferase